MMVWQPSSASSSTTIAVAGAPMPVATTRMGPWVVCASWQSRPRRRVSSRLSPRSSAIRATRSGSPVMIA